MSLAEAEESSPHMQMLGDLSCGPEESELFHEAHLRLLKAVRRVEQDPEDHPTLRLLLLHNLYRWEWRIAKSDRDDPLTYGLFFCLAEHHRELARPLYDEWGNPALRKQGRETGSLLLLESTGLDSAGLQAEWQRLEKADAFDPLAGLMLLGLAMVHGYEAFFEEHLAAVGSGLVSSAIPRGRLGDFQGVLLELQEWVGEEARKLVISPWIAAIHRATSR
jgi:hypothetical protein